MIWICSFDNGPFDRVTGAIILLVPDVFGENTVSCECLRWLKELKLVVVISCFESMLHHSYINLIIAGCGGNVCPVNDTVCKTQVKNLSADFKI